MWLVSGGGDLRSVCAAAANHASPLSAATTPRPSLLRQPRLAPLCCASRRCGAFPAALHQRLQAWQAARTCCRRCRCCRHECQSQVRRSLSRSSGCRSGRHECCRCCRCGSTECRGTALLGEKKTCGVCAGSKTHITELNSASCTGNRCRFSRVRGLDALLRVS